MSEHGYLSDRRMLGMLMKRRVELPEGALERAIANADDDVRHSDNERVRANGRQFMLDVAKYQNDLDKLALELKIASLERTYLRCKIAALTRDVTGDDDIVDAIRREQEQEQLEQRKDESEWRARAAIPKASPDQSSSPTTAESAPEAWEPTPRPESSDPPREPARVPRSRRY